MLDKLMNGPMGVIYIMSKKRARSFDSPVPEYGSDYQHSFDFVNVSKSHSVPGATDEVFQVLRDMSNCHKRKSTKGHTIYATLKNQPMTQTMSEIVRAFFQQYILYDQVYASVNRRNFKLLTANKILRSLICFKDGTVAMKLAKPLPQMNGEQVTETFFLDLPSKERTIFLETKIPFFLLSDLNSAEESAYIKVNNRMD